MKWIKVSLLILTISVMITLAACAQDASTNKMNCSIGGEVCITTSAASSFSKSIPVALRIIVTSSKDFSDLHVTLDTGAEVTVYGPQAWEKFLSSSSTAPGFAFWNFAIKAGQSLTSDRVLHFPSREGYFYMIAEVVNTGKILDAKDSFYVLISKDSGKVITEGTPFPAFTPNTSAAAYGPGTPAPTFLSASLTPTPKI